MFLADRGLVDLVDTSGSQLAKVKITEDGRILADRFWRTGRSLTAFDVAAGAGRSGEEALGQSADPVDSTSCARPEHDTRSAISTDESGAVMRFLDGLRRLVAVDDMPDERRGEMSSLVDRLTDATQAADREALQRCWEHARRPLQAAGPTLAYFMAGAAIPPVFMSQHQGDPPPHSTPDPNPDTN